jgi:hypothetical protein
MSKARPTRNHDDASDLVAAFVSNVGAIHEKVSRLSVDVGRLPGKIKAMHRVANRLHRKIATARQNSNSSIAVSAAASQTESACIGQAILSLLLNRIDAIFPSWNDILW